MWLVAAAAFVRARVTAADHLLWTLWAAAAFVRARVTAADHLLWTLWAAGWGIVYVVYFAVMGW